MKSFRFLIFALLCAVAHGAWAQSSIIVSTDDELREAIANDGVTITVTADIDLSSETISGSVSKAIDVAPGVYILKLNDKVQKIVIE